MCVGAPICVGKPVAPIRSLKIKLIPDSNRERCLRDLYIHIAFLDPERKFELQHHIAFTLCDDTGRLQTSCPNTVTSEQSLPMLPRFCFGQSHGELQVVWSPESVKLLGGVNAAIEGALKDWGGRSRHTEGQVGPLTVQHQLSICPPCSSDTRPDAYLQVVSAKHLTHAARSHFWKHLMVQ